LPAFRGFAAALAACGLTSPAVQGQPSGAVSVYVRPSAADRVEPSSGQSAAAAVPPGEAMAQAQRIVSSSFSRIARASSVAVRIRQKARIGDRVLVGTGRYVQAGRGEEQRFRFESTLTCDTEVFECAEVSDGLFCWSHRRNGGEPPVLQRIDVARVRARMGELGAAAQADPATYLGGLPRALQLVRHWFRFETAVAGDLDGTPAWVVEGRLAWEHVLYLLPELAAAVKARQAVDPAELPDGTPWGVRVWITRSDLLPRRIEWLAIPGRRPVVSTTPEPIAVLELHDFELDAPVDATDFFYQPATEGLIDITDMHCKALWLLQP